MATRRPHAAVWALTLWGWLAPAAVHADVIGRIVTSDAPVRLTRGGQVRSIAAGAELQEGDRIEAVASTRIELGDGAVIVLSPKSSLTVGGGERRHRASGLRLWMGRLWARVAPTSRSFEVETDNAIAGVRGTIFVVEYRDNQTTVTVTEGRVALAQPGGETLREIGPGQSATLDPQGRLVVSALTPEQLESVLREGEREDAAIANDGEALERSATLLETMRYMLAHATELAARARAEKDVVKLHCIEEKVAALRGLLLVAEQADLALGRALAMRDGAGVDREFAKVTMAESKVQRLLGLAESCAGELANYTGETEVEVEHTGQEPLADPFVPPSSPPGSDLLRPPPASPYQ